MKEIKSIDELMQSRFENSKHRVTANIVYTAGWIKNRFKDFYSSYGLSIQQYNILRILRGAGDWLNIQEVRSRMVEKSPNTTRLCDKLEEKGWILRRKGDQDKREVFMKISPDGLDLMSKIDKEDDGSMADFMANFTEEEAEVVSKFLDKLKS